MTAGGGAGMTDDERVLYILIFMAVFLTFAISILLGWE